MKKSLILDHALIDVIGMKKFYEIFKRIYVAECKLSGLTQSQTLIKLNNELKSEGQTKVTLSSIKYLW